MSAKLCNQSKDLTLNDINLTKGYSRLTLDKIKSYKNMYKRLPSKVSLSSTNFLEIFALHILKKEGGMTYGMNILNRLREMFDSEIWKPSHGNLYGLLDQMVVRGYITQTYPENVTLQYNKKFYSITTLGLQVLEENSKDVKIMVKKSEKFFRDVKKELSSNA